MRYKAKFDAQAWVKDNAVSVDAEGPTTWDCTAFITNAPDWVNDPDLQMTVDRAIDKDGEWLDEDDILKGDVMAPKWVQEWDGPFSIYVERSLYSDEQVRKVADAIGHGIDEMDQDLMSNAEEAYKSWDTAKLQRELKATEEAFYRNGGRGVEAADEIDAMRTALALRRLEEKANKKKKLTLKIEIDFPASITPAQAHEELIQMFDKWIGTHGTRVLSSTPIKKTGKDRETEK